MAVNIHPTAIVSPEAALGVNVNVGPYAIIDPEVRIGDDCVIDAHARVCRYTQMGSRNHVHQGAVLGDLPQDAKFHGEVSYLTIGGDNDIREYSTIHRASGEGSQTTVGSGSLLMAYSHIGHNAQIGDEILLASYSGISGHCVIEDYANIAGFVGVHQYTSIGTMAMVGGMSRVVTDVPPYCMGQGNPVELHGLNFRGLIRRDMSEATRRALKRAYRLLYRSPLTFAEAEERIRAEVEVTPEVERLLAFQAAVGQGYAGRQRDPHGKKK
jgi:UDP-N-acetylglucosamine acyltransferase